MATQQSKEQAGGAGDYRVVQVFCTYVEPRERDLGGRKRTLQVQRTGRFGDTIALSAAEAQRLLDAGAVRPAGDAKSYEEMYVDELEELAAARQLEVRGSGANGHVLKQDLVDALSADDSAKLAPPTA